MAKDLVQLLVRVPPKLREQVIELAGERGQSVSELARRVFQAEVDRSSPSSGKKGSDRLATIADVRRLIAEEMGGKAGKNSRK